MVYLEIFSSALETMSVLLVNRTVRGNTIVLFPALLAACWFYKVRLEMRRRRWMSLSPGEQLQRQRAANITGRRNEPYPL